MSAVDSNCPPLGHRNPSGCQILSRKPVVRRATNRRLLSSFEFPKAPQCLVRTFSTEGIASLMSEEVDNEPIEFVRVLILDEMASATSPDMHAHVGDVAERTQHVF